MIKQSKGEFKDQKALRTKLSLFAFGIQDKRTHNYITHYLSRLFDDPKLLVWRTVKAVLEIDRTDSQRPQLEYMQFFDIVIPVVASRSLKRRIEIYQFNCDVKVFDP